MTIAVVCAGFDVATDAAVEQVRIEVEAAGYRARRAHRPHLTLAAARVDEVGAVVEAAREIARRTAAMPLVLAELSTFPSGVLFLQPAQSDGLAALQADAFRQLADAGWPPAFGLRSEPRHWQAHCTIASGLAPPALRRLRRLPFEPVAARVAALVVITVGGRGDVARLPLPG